MRRIGLGVSVLVSAVSLVGFLGCAAPPESADDPKTGASLDRLAVESRGELPACDASTNGLLAYLRDEQRIVVCMSGAWTDVVFPSEKGDKGDTGKIGLSSLVKVTQLSPGDAVCAYGGVKIEVGIDDDRSGVLEAGEVDQTASICQAPVERSRVVFVTSQTFTGKLGGFAGADAKCRAAANAIPALANKTFEAWLCDATQSPSTTFTTDGKLVRVDGMKVADSWADLLAVNNNILMGNKTLVSTISITELGQATTNWTWTGSNANGTFVTQWPYSCDGWTSDAANEMGITGMSTQINSAWCERSVAIQRRRPARGRRGVAVICAASRCAQAARGRPPDFSGSFSSASAAVTRSMRAFSAMMISRT